MKIAGVVHSCHDTKTSIPAKTADGRDVMASVAALVIEVVSEQEGGRSYSFDIVAPDDKAHALIAAQFAIGAKVWVEISARE